MSARGISLTRDDEALYPLANRGDGFRIKITAHDGVLMPNAVFLVLRTTFDPYLQTYNYDFVTVCSPEDIVTFPVGEPDATLSPPYYRTDVLDLIVASREQALQVWEAVEEYVCVLVDALNRKDRLVTAETTRCGEPLEDEPGSLSVSDSISVSV